MSNSTTIDQLVAAFQAACVANDTAKMAEITAALKAATTPAPRASGGAKTCSVKIDDRGRLSYTGSRVDSMYAHQFLNQSPALEESMRKIAYQLTGDRVVRDVLVSKEWGSKPAWWTDTMSGDADAVKRARKEGYSAAKTESHLFVGLLDCQNAANADAMKERFDAACAAIIKAAEWCIDYQEQSRKAAAEQVA